MSLKEKNSLHHRRQRWHWRGNGVTSVDPGLVETEFSTVRFHGDERRAANVYKGIAPLAGEDIADVIVWAVTRPAHVNIARVSLTSVNRANTLLIHREA